MVMCIISGVIPAASCRGLCTVLDNVAWHSLIFSFEVSSQINERSQMAIYTFRVCIYEVWIGVSQRFVSNFVWDTSKITTFLRDPLPWWHTRPTMTTSHPKMLIHQTRKLWSWDRESTALLKTVLYWKKRITFDLGYKLSKLEGQS